MPSVKVPEEVRDIFERAEGDARRYFADRHHIPEKGTIEISGDRLILTR